MNKYDIYLSCACGEVFVTSYDENGEHTTELSEFCDSVAEAEELMNLRDYFYELSNAE